ncbi:hypothetical protein [Thalassobacillus sp. CUG 92003]|uniref:hypothetical protein n=1 Tax=Thalassobacillus sp. CUG 92003 TaxID=2736641 RepID=UPI0015E6C9CC|nr:hypothetical protein [Thalassobacillus sp. CUG 92003]
MKKWYKWTLSAMIGLIIIGTGVMVYLLSGDILNQQEDGDITDEAVEKGEAQETEGENLSSLSIEKFIAEGHQYYNETVGWGRSDSLDWISQSKQADKIVVFIKEELGADAPVAQDDLQAMDDLAAKIIDDQQTEDVVQMHRYFHDLDIAINDFSEYEKVWGVTDTLDERD